jgi:hypothetical protein
MRSYFYCSTDIDEGKFLMVKLIDMDDSVTLQEQMMTEAGPVILINQFKVKPAEADQLIAAWAHDAFFLKHSRDPPHLFQKVPPICSVAK